MNDRYSLDILLKELGIKAEGTQCSVRVKSGDKCAYTQIYDYVSCPFLTREAICQYDDRVNIVLGKYSKKL